MQNHRSPSWTRREWLSVNGAALVAVQGVARRKTSTPGASPTRNTAGTSTSEPADFSTWEALAQQGVDAARAAGATYADVRITRIVGQDYRFGDGPGNFLFQESERMGVGVRALVNGFWGFSSAPRADAATVARLARDAVAQATVNALGTSRPVELVHTPAVRGRWTTPVKIDPFSISIDEKNDYMTAWLDYSVSVDSPIDTIMSYLGFARQERVVATSDGSLFGQTIYECGGVIACSVMDSSGQISFPLDGVRRAGKGWELFLDADIFGQLSRGKERLAQERALRSQARSATVGRYTIVCDGATMASIVGQTLGLATQLDRAMGYEANASGTSFLNDPLGMLGATQVTSPLVTLTANRSAPGQLATVQWDDEGVAPQPFPLIKDGVLVDYQTTREQAAWLAPYYHKNKLTATSRGCAAAEDGLHMTMQHVPNLELAPSTGNVTVQDLIANVTNGIYVTQGIASTDFQARNGMIDCTMQKITNGRLGQRVSGGGILFHTSELWKQIVAVGGATTQDFVSTSQYPFGSTYVSYGFTPDVKGQPPQIVGHTITAPAATITGQAVVDPTRRA